MSVEAAITIYSNIIWRRLCYSHQTNIVEVTIKFTLFFSEFTGHFLTCISGETDDRQDSLNWVAKKHGGAHLTLYIKLFIRFFKRPNTLTYTFLRIGISDSWWHGKQVVNILKWKRKLSRSVIQCYCGCGFVTWQIWRVAMEYIKRECYKITVALKKTIMI